MKSFAKGLMQAFEVKTIEVFDLRRELMDARAAQRAAEEERDQLRRFREQVADGFNKLAAAVSSEPEVQPGAMLPDVVLAVLMRQRNELMQLRAQRHAEYKPDCFTEQLPCSADCNGA